MHGQLHAINKFAQRPQQPIQRTRIVNARPPPRLIPRHLPSARHDAAVRHFPSDSAQQFHNLPSSSVGFSLRRNSLHAVLLNSRKVWLRSFLDSSTERSQRPSESFATDPFFCPGTGVIFYRRPSGGLTLLGTPHFRPRPHSQFAPHCFIALRTQQLQKFPRIVRIVLLRSAKATANLFQLLVPLSF